MSVHETVVPRPGTALERLTAADDDLWRRGLLSLVVSRDDTPVLTLHPHAAPPPRPSHGGTGRPVSELTVLRRVGEQYALESARAWCSVRVEQPDELPALLTGKGDLCHYLDWACLTADESESAQLSLAQWTPHELAFHQQTRVPGVHRDAGFGRSHWGRGSPRCRRATSASAARGSSWPSRTSPSCGARTRPSRPCWSSGGASASTTTVIRSPPRSSGTSCSAARATGGSCSGTGPSI
ncbi:hypothetical protein [Nonomuraea salmonea]|uniref:hypothetical protein n=1 Tax=Nonomuraea salmonea TaxID=46181 RepID=UPI002FED8E0A